MQTSTCGQQLLFRPQAKGREAGTGDGCAVKHCPGPPAWPLWDGLAGRAAPLPRLLEVFVECLQRSLPSPWGHFILLGFTSALSH